MWPDIARRDSGYLCLRSFRRERTWPEWQNKGKGESGIDLRVLASGSLNYATPSLMEEREVSFG